ncbi:DedA family protein [Daejeonella sp.]|uniref:DedA family protein n=1 Tax=Daejeonella sp. TaxID=2805397 RepID=UPI002731E86D|nr:VTT domain-containing protein [Daejeonella sp.]MDP2414265.1 VTT domain-containing protein [Daejeonella sp.]
MDIFVSISVQELLNPEFYIVKGGLWIVLLIVFAETGLMAGFFLPGDSLLFVSGIYSKTLVKSLPGYQSGFDLLDLFILVLLITICGSLGNLLGFWFGKQSGQLLFKRKDTFFFKKRHLLQAETFFDKHGAMALILARFLPIIRTFTPVVAGVVGMEKVKFITYSIFGMILWATFMLFSGRYLYLLFLNQFGFDIKKHLEIIVLGIALITTLPVLYKILKTKENSLI